jgi:drug/metabolite transporter (DMT)-like permease
VKRIALGFILMPLALLVIGFIMGIIPGLLLGLLGWHKVAAVIISIVWAIGYILQRAITRRDVNWITFCVAILGGAGVALSIWLFGDITS